MYDITVTMTDACTRRLLHKLQENTTWARMGIKPNNPHSISIVRGQLTNEKFHFTILDKPIKSLDRCYNAELKNSETGRVPSVASSKLTTLLSQGS